MKKTIAIWILDESYFEDIYDYHTKWVIKEEKTNQLGYFEDLEFHFLELKKLRERDILAPKKLEFWMWFIDHTNKELIEVAYKSEEEVREAMEKLKELSSDKELVDLVFRERLYEMDRKSELKQAIKKAEIEALKRGEKKGEKRGEREEKIKTAKRLLQKGREMEIIIEATGLSQQEIEKIKKE